MSSATASGEDGSGSATESAVAAVPSFCRPLFASMARKDQRDRGMKYVEGLLAAQGRRSFRNMAACLGGGATLEQRLHHFVSCSTWDWTPVRAALAARMAPAAPPEAWVLRTMLAPKEGNNSVGVHRRYAAEAGQFRNLQYAVGLWAASRTASYPVSWRLLLPHVWTDDTARRARASIPRDARTETPTECAIETYLGLPGLPGSQLPVKPVVLAIDEVDVVGALQTLRAAGVPFLVKVDRRVPLGLVAPTLRLPGGAQGRGAGPLSIRRILAAVEGLRQPVRRTGPGAGPHHSLVAAVPVHSPLRSARPGFTAADDDLLLVGIGPDEQSWPQEAWLAHALGDDPAALLELTSLTRQVDASFDRITEPLGLRDFTGRTFDGWNRHVTLTSLAHAITVLGELPQGTTQGRRTLPSPAALLTESGAPPGSPGRG